MSLSLLTSNPQLLHSSCRSPISILEMPDCPNASGCPLFRLFVLSASLEMWKQRYCQADFKVCARYQLSEDGKPVPPNLLPNGRMLAARTPEKP